jgi:hypothetical protein
MAFIKRTLQERMEEALGPRLVSCRALTDGEFLSLFNIAELPDLLTTGNTSSAIFHLLDNYKTRVSNAWLSPSKTLTDLRLNLEELSNEELVQKADGILTYNFLPGDHAIKLTADGNINWQYNPLTSREWLLRLHRHQWWPVLGLAFKKTGDERYAAAFVDQMLNWIEENPPPVRKNERNTAWRLMEVGLRLRESWIPSFALFYNSALFNADAKLKMLRSIYDQARFLFLFKTNRNHLLRESNGLACAAVYFSEFKDAFQWRYKALSRIDSEISKQIHPDGCQIEVSTGYQWVVVDELEKTLDLLGTHRLSLPNENLVGWVEKMYQVLANLIRPDGSFPEINDGFIRWQYPRLARAGEKLNRNDFIFIGSRGKRGSAPSKTSIRFRNGGYYIMRSDWSRDARYLLFIAGPYGGPHGHEDKLSIEVAAFGQSFIVDSGSYTYEKSDPYRAYFVGSQAHNTVLVDGLSQVRRWQKQHMHPESGYSADAVWISNTGIDYAAASYGEGYSSFFLKKPENPKIVEDVRHTRRVVFVKPDYWVIIDTLEAEAPHHYQLLFHTPPDVEARIDAELKVELCGTSSKAHLHIIPAEHSELTLRLESGKESPIQGWFSLDHHYKVPSTVVIYDSKVIRLKVYRFDRWKFRAIIIWLMR